MGRSRSPRRPSLLLTLALLVAAGGAAAYALPRGTHPAADRVRKAVDVLLARVAPAKGAPSPAAPAGRTRRVERVVDGDTVVLDGGERVRLLGIDTPETVDPRRPVERFGREASVFARSLLQGRRVRVETDVEPRDRYGRTLAYLYLEDGTFVNLRLVEEGYASASRHPPNVRHAGLLRDAERRAREAGRGLWSDRGRAKGFEGGAETR